MPKLRNTITPYPPRKVVIFLIIIASSFNACSPPRKVAVEERVTVSRAQEREKIGGSHIRIVAPGDTIYGIAFANGLNAKQLAAWNKVGDTSKLRVGQRVRLTEPVGFVYKSKPMPRTSQKSKSSHASEVATTDTKVANAKPKSSDIKKVARINSAPEANSWRWPTAGNITQRFNKSAGEQGIDIAGNLGQPIHASRAGEVVYVGNGLKGYGNLVILKHDDEFLSAYAHNRETFVREGQRLLPGSRIASMGRDKKRIVLHFQIRRYGDPVDPLRFLRPR